MLRDQHEPGEQSTGISAWRALADEEARVAGLPASRIGRDGLPPRALAGDLEEDRETSQAATPVHDLTSDATMNTWLQYAAMNNPGLEAAFFRWQAALERLPQVRALPDPMLTYGVFIQEIETRVGPMQQQISLAQRIPWFGTLAAREDAAALAAIAAFHEFDAARLVLFEDVRTHLTELWYLEQSREIVDASMQLLEQAEAILRTRIRVGSAGPGDLVRIQIELARLEDRLQQIEETAGRRRAMLNATLNRSADAPLPPAPVPIERSASVIDTTSQAFETPGDAGSPMNTGDTLDPDDRTRLRSSMETTNPSLLAQRARKARAAVNQELARLSGGPDLTFGVAWTRVEDPARPVVDSGKDPVLATFSLNLPIWRAKYEAAEREAIAERLALAAGETAIVARLDAELEQQLSNLRDGQRRISLYDNTLIPKAEEALEITLAGLRSDTADLLDLLDAEQTRIDLQLERARALADASIAEAVIERIAGTPLNIVDTDDETDPNTNVGSAASAPETPIAEPGPPLQAPYAPSSAEEN
ncbi:MAG: TolC family protein [Planctomycetota bacterium]